MALGEDGIFGHDANRRSILCNCGRRPIPTRHRLEENFGRDERRFGSDDKRLNTGIHSGDCGGRARVCVDS